MNLKEKVVCHIKELGPVRDSEIELNKLMIFTGNSNVGKSYTAFLAYYFLTALTSQRLKPFVMDKVKSQLKNNTIRLRFTISELRKWMNQDVIAFIGYLLGDESFSCDVDYAFLINNESDYLIEYTFVSSKDKEISSDELIQVIASHNDKLGNDIISHTLYPPYLEREYILIQSFVRSISNLLLNNNMAKAIILPPARASLMGASYTLSEIITNVGMYKNFLIDFEYITQILERPRRLNRKDRSFYDEIISKLTNGELVKEKKDFFLQMKNGKRIPLSAAASSVKELSPLFFLLQKWDVNKFSVLFEEPEAHVHPYNQNLIADLITHSINNGAFYQITTHSDYILHRINQLIRLGNLKRETPALFEEFCKQHTHNQSLFLDYSMVNAYFFEENDKGEVKIIKQDVKEGIPFLTFSEVIDDQLKIDREIENLTENI